MAKNKSGNKDNKITLDFNKELESLKTSIDNLSVDIDLIKNGNEDGPLWNGTNAVECIKNINKFIENNSNIISDLDNISEEINNN